MQRLMESLGEGVMAMAWPVLFGMAMLAMIIGRMVRFGEREDSVGSASKVGVQSILATALDLLALRAR